MPTIGRTEDSNLDVVRLPLSNAADVSEFSRKRERARMLIPDEPEPIIQLSKEQQVYIYNVGPWAQLQQLASYGSRTIPGLSEELVFKGMAVAGPLVIDGIPSECYPAEGEAKRIYHRPLKNRGRQSARPGLDFAMEVIGCGTMVNPSCDLRPLGVFISEQPEQKAPGPKASPEDVAAFKKWESDVKEAQTKLRTHCSKMCQDANIEYSRGRFAEIRTDKLYQAARLINGTENQYGWLKDTGEKADNKNCFACGSVIKGFALKCPHCGEMQVSAAEMEAERKRRMEATL